MFKFWGHKNYVAQPNNVQVAKKLTFISNKHYVYYVHYNKFTNNYTLVISFTSTI